jgi:hypothetical protein
VWGGDETNTAADGAVVSLFVFTPLIVMLDSLFQRTVFWGL